MERDGVDVQAGLTEQGSRGRFWVHGSRVEWAVRAFGHGNVTVP